MSLSHKRDDGVAPCVVSKMSSRTRDSTAKFQVSPRVIKDHHAGCLDAEASGFDAVLIAQDLNAWDSGSLIPKIGFLPAFGKGGGFKKQGIGRYFALISSHDPGQTIDAGPCAGAAR